ncbi:MAG: hypothetical protein JXA68_12065 [Ignavibacteriales bacterium]|nr:hypothetical protein [Ignavibacteriales bacterium]
MSDVNKNINLNGLENYLRDNLIGFFEHNKITDLVKLFHEQANKFVLNQSSEANLIRILSSIYNRVSFLEDCIKYPHHIEIVVTIACSSNFLTDIVIRNPHYLYQLFNQEYLAEELIADSFADEINSGLFLYDNFKSKVNFLRLLKNRSILKIGLNDIQNNWDLKKITEQLSILANSILENLFELCYMEIVNKYNLRIELHRYCLVSLGKLGGNELNYSSDVDLMLFFDENTFIKEGKDYFEVLNEVTNLFIATATEMTDNGYLYRIDFRLRPDGRFSPLCRTSHDLLVYYETRGENWERQMLIKMNLVSGDAQLYIKVKEYLSHFVYPTSFFNSPLEQIKKLKVDIEKKSSEENIKLSSGGIRNIEFTVQSLQLLNGGRIINLRTGNTLEAIEKLKFHNLISEKESKLLMESYYFYRRIEHFLQLMNDTQTHSIPTDAQMLEKLVRYLKIENVNSFKSILNNKKNEVSQIFYTTLSLPQDENSIIINSFDNVNFQNRDRALKNIRYLQSGIGLLGVKEFDKKTIDSFSSIEDTLIKILQDSYEPDRLLDNFSSVIINSQMPSLWYSELEDENFMEQFFRICKFSQKAINILVNNKNLSELLFTRQVFKKELEDIFDHMELKQLQFILSVQFALKLINYKLFSTHLTKFIEFVINNLTQKLNLGFKYFISGLGSFGANDMNFNSDLDLLVIVEDGNEFTEKQDVFREFLNQINKLLSPIQVDLRLRPEGKNSILVWTIDEYVKYIEQRARVWEFQALLKSRFVCGDRKLFDNFVNAMVEKIKGFNSDTIINETIKMYNKLTSENILMKDVGFNLKKGRGGLVNLEFIIQSYMLINLEQMQTYIGEETSTILFHLSNSEENRELFNNIFDNYVFIKQFEIALQNIFDVKGNNIPTNTEKKNLLAEYFDFNSIKEFDEKITTMIKNNIEMFKSYFGLKNNN